MGSDVPNGGAQLAVYRTDRWSTTVELVVTDPRAVAAATAILDRQLDRTEQVASRFRPDSEINRLQAAVAEAPDRTHRVSHDLYEAVAVAVRAAALSDGAVDPTVGAALCRLGYDRDFSLVAAGVPGSLPAPQPVPGWQTVTLDRGRNAIGMLPGTVLDLGATAKAWAADRACAAIADELGCGTMVSLGGDIAVANAPEGGFTVGIADICGDRTTTVRVSIESGGLATSGIGRRHWTLGRPPGPPPGQPRDRPARRLLLEDGVGGGRIVRRRQHGVHRGDGQGGRRRALAGGPEPAGPPGATGRPGITTAGWPADHGVGPPADTGPAMTAARRCSAPRPTARPCGT